VGQDIKQLVVRASFGLTESYAQEQRIPQEAVHVMMPAYREATPVYTANLADTPYGESQADR